MKERKGHSVADQARSNAQRAQELRIMRVCRAAIEEFRKSAPSSRLDSVDERLLDAVRMRLYKPRAPIPRNPEAYLFTSIVLALGFDFSEDGEAP